MKLTLFGPDCAYAQNVLSSPPQNTIQFLLSSQCNTTACAGHPDISTGRSYDENAVVSDSKEEDDVISENGSRDDIDKKAMHPSI